MKLSRRDFLKIGAGAAATTAAVPLLKGLPSPKGEGVGVRSGDGLGERFIRTVCSLCPSGCGLQVRVVGDRVVKVEGNPLHPLNQGVCCPKGQASLEILYSPERLAGPLRRKGQRGAGQWERISWDEALGDTATRLRALRHQGQAHTVAFLYGEARGQMRPLIQRFLAAYGSPNAISSDSLDGQAARLAMYLTQGVNGYPVYDLENARYVMAFGGSILEAGRHLQRYLSGVSFMRRGRPDRSKLVVVDPRLSVSAAKADEWIPLRPGTLGALALGMAHVIIKSGMVDKGFVDNWTYGFEDFVDDRGNTHQGFKGLVLDRYNLDRVADITGIPGGTIARLAGEFGTYRPSLALLPTSRGAMAGGNGLYTAMAIHALNALVGSIEVPGGVQVQQYPDLTPWSALPADPVAEKGRSQPRVDGAGTEYPLALSAYQAVAEGLASSQPYPVNALFLYNANPIFEAPQGTRFAEAFRQVPFIVSFSPVLDESSALADLILPSPTFLEMWQDDIVEGTGYPGIAIRQPVVKPVQEARNPGDVLLQLARAVGGPVAQALPWASFQEVIRFRVAGMGISWDDLLDKGAWSGLVYFFAAPGSKAWYRVVGPDRLAAPKDGRFDFFSRELFYALSTRGQPVEDLACLPHFALPVESAQAKDYPFLLVSQELMTQARGWSGVVPSLEEVYGLQVGSRWGSWVEIHAKAAQALGVHDGDEVWVESPVGRIRLQAKLVQGIWPNAVHIPWGQGYRSTVQWGREAQIGARAFGVNPYQIVAASTERLDGLAVLGPMRVRVYKA